jgi:hypothetical protein
MDFCPLFRFFESLFCAEEQRGDNALTGKEKYAVIIENGA